MSESPQVRRLADWDAEHLRAVAGEHGTPTYLLDLDRVRQNAARLQAAFPDAEVAYAVKANAVAPVLATLSDAGLAAECASAGEVSRALAAGFDAADVRYTAVNPPARDLDRVCALEGDLVVTVGAADTLDRLAERGFSGRVCVRVNPGVGAGHHEKVATGAEPKFGVPYDRATEVAAAVREDPDLELVGWHAHVGSGVSGEDLAAHRELVERVAALAREVPVAFASVGGGLGVPAREDEPPLDLAAVADATRAAFDCDARLAIEPGRYLVADAGVLLTRVTTVKPTPTTTVVGVDAGMTDLLRPALYDAHHPVRSLAPDAGDRDPVGCEVAGPVCETADVLGRDRALPAPARGDLLAVGVAGAYGYEMASTYNSRPRPPVAVVGDDPGSTGTAPRTGRAAVRREAVTDLTRLERW